MNQRTANGAIEYRRMRAEDLPAAHGLSQAVRWPHRLEDWQFFHRLGIGFVAEEDGAIIGTAMCWLQGNRHGSLGMIIVSPQHQGKGIGRKLMNLVLEELGERCTELNATVAGKPLYESLGFKVTGSLHQHQGVMAHVAPVALAEGETIRAAEAGDLAQMIELANRGSGMMRGDMVKQLMAEAAGAVIERDGELTGFSILRRFGRGQVIGPLVAPDSVRAKALITYWAAASAGSLLRLDVTGASGLGDWLAQAGLPEVDTAVIMARHGAPAQDPSVQQFAIISQALC